MSSKRALKAKRSAAARKGWETRRVGSWWQECTESARAIRRLEHKELMERAAAHREAAAQQLRRERALKGWETRRTKRDLDKMILPCWSDAERVDRRWLPYSQPNWVARGRPMLAADLGIEPKWWAVVINDDAWKDVDWGAYRGPGYGISLAADILQAHAKALAAESAINEHLYGPNPWPRLAAKVRRWWQRATQWWRP